MSIFYDQTVTVVTWKVCADTAVVFLKADLQLTKDAPNR